MAENELHAALEAELPLRLPVGRGNAILVHGWCYDAAEPIQELALTLDGFEHRALAQAMPRADVHASEDAARDPHGYSYRSGFWGLVPLLEGEVAGRLDLGVAVRLRGGERKTRTLGILEVEPGHGDESRRSAARPAAAGPQPLTCVCMASCDPPAGLLRAQLDSLRAQEDDRWICVIADDHSRPGKLAEIRAAIGDDPRFELHEHAERVGPYRNFERALRLAPPEAELIAFCDQDDRWHPDKLTSLRPALETGAQLAYSDMQVVNSRGTVISPTYWTARANNHTNLAQLVMVNTVTGAASMFRRSLLDYALPFPEPGPDSFHDHWLALVALSVGELAYIDRPLYDYVQHPGAALGHRLANQPQVEPPLLERIAGLRPKPGDAGLRQWLLQAGGDRLERWRRDYPYLLRVLLTAEVLRLRCGEQMTDDKRRQVEHLIRMARGNAAFGWLGWRALRARADGPTLGKERQLLRAKLWRAGVAARSRVRTAPKDHDDRQTFVLPPRLASVEEPPRVRTLGRLTEPLRLRVDPGLPQRVNLLIPKIDLAHFFGGYIAKLNLARRLAETGVPVRVLCLDPPDDVPQDWRERIVRYEGLGTLLDKVEVESAHDRRVEVVVSPQDRFVATTWWTAHVAHAAVTELGGAPFTYLIQECEHLTFAMGSFAASALESYGFPHRALFSTELLRGYFRAHRLGVYAAGEQAGDATATIFRNAITPVRPAADTLMQASARSLLFYARPEEHAHRNMFELGMLGLAQARDSGALEGVSALGVGAQRPRRVRVSAGMTMELIPRREQPEYAELLHSHAVGLALMHTPHPSLVPLEMAAAGMLVVTNTFENKTAAELASISSNLIAVEPTVAGVADGLGEAAAAAHDVARRRRGADFDWPRSWDEAFADPLVERVRGFLEVE